MRVSTIKGYSQFQKYTGVDNNENQRMLSPNSSVSFKGHKYPSGEYTDEEVAIAKRFINQIGDSWKQTFKKENTKSFGELYLNSHGLNYPLSYVGDFIAAAVDDTDDYLYMTRKEKAEMTRLVNNVGTLGVFEVLNSPVSATEAGIRKLSENHKINKQTVRIAMLINDMKAEEEAKALLRNKKPMLDAISALEQENNLLKLKGEINNKFSQLINYEKIGKQVEIPNVIMIHDPQCNVADELVNYTRTNSDVLYDRVKGVDSTIMQRDLYEKLQTGKINYEKSKIRTLLEVENMGKMISKDASFSLTEWMKSVMTACADKYKTTLIFKTKDTSGYVSEALEPHRIGLKIINGLKKIK